MIAHQWNFNVALSLIKSNKKQTSLSYEYGKKKRTKGADDSAAGAHSLNVKFDKIFLNK